MRVLRNLPFSEKSLSWALGARFGQLWVPRHHFGVTELVLEPSGHFGPPAGPLLLKTCLGTACLWSRMLAVVYCVLRAAASEKYSCSRRLAFLDNAHASSDREVGSKERNSLARNQSSSCGEL